MREKQKIQIALQLLKSLALQIKDKEIKCSAVSRSGNEFATRI